MSTEPPLFKAKVLHDYATTEEDELSLTKGTIISIIEADGNWWRAIDDSGKKGILPCNYVQRIIEEEAPNVPPRLPPKRPSRKSMTGVAPALSTRPSRTSNLSSSKEEIETLWDFSTSNINMAQPVWRKPGFSELMLDGYFSKKLHPGGVITSAVSAAQSSSKGAAKKAHESRVEEFSRIKISINLINNLIDALIVGPLPTEEKKVAWDVQAAFRECAQLMDSIVAIPGSEKSSGPTTESCFPYITRVADMVRTMSPGQIRIFPGGWTEPKPPQKKSSSKDDKYFHVVLYVVSRNDSGGHNGREGFRFVVVNYAVKSPSTDGFHPKRIAASDLSVQYQTNVVFDNIPGDRLRHTAFWIALLRPLLVSYFFFSYVFFFYYFFFIFFSFFFITILAVAHSHTTIHHPPRLLVALLFVFTSHCNLLYFVIFISIGLIGLFSLFLAGPWHTL